MKKLMSYTIITILVIPAIMIFNDDYDKCYLNLIGIAYSYLLFRYGCRLFPI